MWPEQAERTVTVLRNTTPDFSLVFPARLPHGDDLLPHLPYDFIEAKTWGLPFLFVEPNSPLSSSPMTMRRNSEASSSCRIERKRAHDREAQRASRAKTKQYIAHLEKTVADLTDSSGDNRANYLAQHASHQSQEIDKLQGLVNKIRSLVHDATKSEDGSPGNSKGEGSNADSSAAMPTDAFSAMNWDTQSEDQWITEISKPTDFDSQQQQQRRIEGPQVGQSSRNLVVLGINLYCENGDETTYFPRLNELIEKIEKTPDNLSTLSEDMDILTRAIVCGWDAAERVHHFDIVWRFLRAFDEGLWYRAQPMERFAHFWNMRSTMLHKIQPKNQPRRAMASFMSPTIGQRSSKHPSVVDYFGWPQARNHLLNIGIKQCTGRAAVAFTESFHFVWPWEVRDAYKVNKQTGLYSFSNEFLQSFNDVSSFRLLANQLIPFEVHPQSRTVPEEDLTDVVEEQSVEEFVFREPSFGPATADQDHNMTQADSSPEDWMATLASLHEAGRHGMHNAIPTFTMAHEASMTPWPAV